MKRIASILLAILAIACTTESGSGISSIENPRADKLVSVFGETVTVTFAATDAWSAELVLSPEGDWAEIYQAQGNDGAGKGIVRVKFAKNTTESERTAELYVAIKGHDKELIATLTQAAGENKSAMSEYLNKYMDERLVNEYLWAEDYSKLTRDMSISYDKFLYTHLTKLGDTNIEDGGYYRDYSSSRGERYIYSYIQEVTTTKAPVMTKAGELSSTYGLGIGPLFASVFESGTDYIGLTVGYVYPGSPAEAAGLRRGDTIYQVGNSRITRSDYQRYMQELFYSPKGTYQLGVARYEINEAAQKYDLNLNHTIEITPSEYGYNPIIFAAIMTNQNVDGDSDSNIPAFNIGYMASESFDSSAQEVLEYQIKQFIDAGITELILDLRYNVGGEVQQSRYLASSIVGHDYDDKDFFKAEFVGKRVEPWKFKSGPTESDKLGVAPAMGLKRLWVIMSENTASASELIIHGLKGVDFPVTLIGSRSEGKNVGMTTTRTTYDNRTFLFSPITFRVSNAKGFGDYPDGIAPDVMVNNQNSSYADDADNVFPYSFGDWGNMGFNVALRYAYEDILGISRSQSVRQQSSESEFKPLEFCAPAEYKIGRYGNVIYKMED